MGDFKNCRAFYTKKVIDDFNDLFSRFSTHAWKNLVRLFLPFGSGSGGRGSGASVRVFFSGIARVISAHDRTRGHYYAKAVSKKKQHMLLYYDDRRFRIVDFYPTTSEASTKNLCFFA